MGSDRPLLKAFAKGTAAGVAAYALVAGLVVTAYRRVRRG